MQYSIVKTRKTRMGRFMKYRVKLSKKCRIGKKHVE